MLAHISWRHTLLAALALSGIVIVFMQPPIPQNPGYHAFADDRPLFGIPGFWNVMSNLPFIIIGTLGIRYLLRNCALQQRSYDSASLLFFSGILLTGFGSAWYHCHPDNHSMVWDRLPMTIAFMAFFSVIIRECLHEKTGKYLLFPLLFLGILSVCYWQLTESQGRGDLRLYFLVQFLPMALIPLILLLFKTRTYPKRYFWLVLLAYVIAKVFEVFDVEVFQSTGISGHTIKHVMAAVAPFVFLAGIKNRKPNAQLP